MAIPITNNLRPNISQMAKLNAFVFCCLSMALLACRQTNHSDTQTPSPKIPVQIVTISNGSVRDDLELSATSVYLQRSIVTSPVPAFISKVDIHLGAHVSRGQVLYELETKERRALGNDVSHIDTSLKNFGLIKVRATASGIVGSFDKQQAGEYIMEGTQLCTVVSSGDVAFQINVPYEFSQIVAPGKKCTVTLPDHRVYNATITTPLTAMNTASQTQTLLARPEGVPFLPENLIAKVEMSKGPAVNGQILPKACVLSDEMMESFWVMKLINDTTAIKVPVKIGNKDRDKVAIISPLFAPGDRIIADGNYGLPDTAKVKIVSSKN